MGDEMSECIICSSPSDEQAHLNWHVTDCRRCGRWALQGIPNIAMSLLQGKLGNWDALSVHLRSHLSHIVRCQQRGDGGFVQIPLDGLQGWHLESPLPKPSEQLDQLVLWLGNHQSSPGESIPISVQEISAWIGATITRKAPGAGLEWVLSQESAGSLLESGIAQSGSILMRLKMSGWTRFEALKRGQVESRRVLMGMKFNDPELDRVVQQCFRPAVKRAGYELRILTDQQPAGLIDDQLRVALRTSRFVVADLTHGNNGAYWEAGFAEGLGRPVIYTCREAEWTERKTHFDTNHLVTVIWNVETLEHVGAQLAATIRATLPAEARMIDE
jgi:hypothetical protein